MRPETIVLTYLVQKQVVICGLLLTVTRASMGVGCCKQEDGKDDILATVGISHFEEVPYDLEDLVMGQMCCTDERGKDPTEILPVVRRTLDIDMVPAFCGAQLPENCEIMSETLEMLKRKCSMIAGAEMELLNSQQAQAYADVLNRVLEVLAVSMQFPAQTRVCDLSDTSVLMVAVAPPEQLSKLVSTPHVVVLTQEPAATSVHDDRFKTMVSKLCRSLSSTVRRGSSARHIAVSRVSGEILATAAAFVQKPRVTSQQAEQSTPLNALELAKTLGHGVVFAAYERGGLVVLPCMDVARRKAFRLAPIVRKV